MDEEINLRKDKGHKVAVLNTELSSVYDTVSHSLLRSKLEHIGVRGRSLKFFTSFLENRNFTLMFKAFAGN